MMEKICSECGAVFKCKPSHFARRKFCSQSCLGVANARRLHATSREWRPKLKPWVRVPKGVRVFPDTEFKPGIVPTNKLPVGSERIRVCKNGTRRAFIKIAEPNIWQLRAIMVWESIHGPLPKNLLIHHKDRNPLNDKPENLVALTRVSHLEEHRAEHQERRKERA